MNVLGIPSVELVLQQPAIRALVGDVPRSVLVQCVRECVAALREDRQTSGARGATKAETAAAAAEMAAQRLRPQDRPTLRRVVNATGVIIHTNLGRSPIGPKAIEAMAAVAGAYCNLEVDTATGGRSHRDAHVASLLARITGAEAATIVNNNAAAVVLTLTALAAGQRVVCSRGELVEIGGSFRLPEIIACSGATMVEVGTTNHTRLSDYEAALTPDTALRQAQDGMSPPNAAAILKIHPSNFRLIGFTSDVALKPLADLARRTAALLIFDAAPALLFPGGHPVFANEPVVRQAVADGADIVTFSADKLLGGPQGGAIVGRRALIERINRHPLKRAVRVGKLTLAGMEATLRAHLQAGDAPDTLTMRLIRRPAADIEEEAEEVADALRRVVPAWKVAVEMDESSVGGGSLPGETVPTLVVWLEAPDLAADALDRAFRANEPPIFGRFRRGRFGLDVRTLLPGDADDVIACIQRLSPEKPEPKLKKAARRRKTSGTPGEGALGTPRNRKSEVE